MVETTGYILPPKGDRAAAVSEPQESFCGRAYSFLDSHKSEMRVTVITLGVALQILGLVGGKGAKAKPFIALVGSAVFVPYAAYKVAYALKGRIKGKKLSTEERAINFLIAMGVLAAIASLFGREAKAISGVFGRGNSGAATLVFKKILPAVSIGSSLNGLALAAHRTRGMDKKIRLLEEKIEKSTGEAQGHLKIEKEHLLGKRKRLKVKLIQVVLSLTSSLLGLEGWKAFSGSLSITASSIAFGRFLYRRRIDKERIEADKKLTIDTAVALWKELPELAIGN